MTPAVKSEYSSLCEIVATSTIDVAIDTEGSVDAGDVDVKANDWNIWGED